LAKGFFSENYVNFFLNMNFPEYFFSLDKKKQERVEYQVVDMINHARQSFYESPSDFSWEADVRHDVFGVIRDDSRLRMFAKPS
jgi:hypothetical protein